MKEKTWVVIAAYNEERNISTVIDEVKKFCKNIIVVDDGSTDKTADIIKNKKVFLVRNKVNSGKGIAARNGCDYAIKKGATQLILIDADGQHEAKEIPRFLRVLKDKDIVFGYRRLSGNMPAVYRLGNRFINFITRILFSIDMYDTQSGYRAMTSETYNKVRWESSGYEMESEVVSKAGAYDLTYAQIPIRTIYKDNYKGTTIFDGIRIVISLIKWKIKGK